MAFTCPAWTQFTDVVIVFNERNHPSQNVPLHIDTQCRRLHTDRPYQTLAPLVRCQSSSPLEELVHIHVRHLDWLEQRYPEWRTGLPFLVVITQSGNDPDTTNQQLLVLFDDPRRHFSAPDPRNAEGSLILTLALIQFHGHPVYDFQGATLFDQ